MRCPNPICREVFEIRAEEAEIRPEIDLPGHASADRDSAGKAGNREDVGKPATVSHKDPQRTGSVGDMVPILSAEVVSEAAPAAAGPTPAASSRESVIPLTPAAPNWQAAPPPVRNTPAAELPPADSSQPVKKKTIFNPMETLAGTVGAVLARAPRTAAAGPVELPPGSWDAAPPVRRSAGANMGEDQRPTPAPAATSHSPEGAPAELSTPARSRAPWLVAFLLLAVLGISAGTAWTVFHLAQKTESERLQQAREELEAGKYALAAEKFRGLERDFPESDQKTNYRFHAELGDILDQAHQLQVESVETSEKLRSFLKAHDGDPLLEEHSSRFGATFLKLAEDFIERARQAGDPALLTRAEAELKDAEHTHPAAAGSAKARELRTRIASIRGGIAKEQQRRQLYADLGKLAATPAQNGPEKARHLLQKAAAEQPELSRDARVQELLARIAEGRRGLVVWTEGGASLQPPEDERAPSLLIVPSVFKQRSLPPEKGRVFFALAHGVLYALDQSNGHVRWASRVGIDTATLPVRLPATESSPEIVLVPSSDTNTLTAREAQSGRPLWRHCLTAPCLGQPVIVARRAYVPTYDGRVNVLEIIDGKLLGSYDLGQPLAVGGARQEGTPFLYFPAESRTIFVLDSANPLKPCPAILQSDHPSGSLRSAPIVISRQEQRKIYDLDPAAWPDYLVLNQSEDLDSTRLRVFALPVQGTAAPPVLAREPLVQGWTWFPPYHDSEKLVQVTDAGVLGLIGIRQVRNEDKDLFLENKNVLELGPRTPLPGRAQVVHVLEDDIWVLARGELQLYHFNRYARKVVPLWSSSLSLGSPLHASQVETAGPNKTLFVVTQSLSQPTCLATALSASVAVREVEVHWQRQLGMLCRSEPLVLGQQVWALDQGGGLFRFEPGRQPGPVDREWQTGGQLIAGPFEDEVDRPYLLSGRDGKSAVLVAAGTGNRIYLRRQEPGKNLIDKTWTKHPPLAGRPGVADNGLVLALVDGKLLHVPFDGLVASEGPEWRARHAPREAPGHVAHLGGDEFLTTDGSRGLTRWRWPGGPSWEIVTPAAELPERIGAPPLVLPGAGTGEDCTVSVADVRGTVTLLRDRSMGTKRAWTTLRGWPLAGRITAGPFLRGSLIGCVVDNERLVCIDPDQDRPVWEYRRQGEAIVGQPQLVENLLIVAHQTGRWVGLDPATGRPLGQGYSLKANVAPAAAPVAFGPDRAFAPLTDGTVLLLELKHLRSAARTAPSP